MLQRRIADNKPTPAMDNRPILHEDLHEVWSIYNLLHRTRMNGGFGPCPLQLPAIQAALELHGYDDPDSVLYVIELLLDMDKAWLEWANESVKKDKTPNGKPAANH